MINQIIAMCFRRRHLVWVIALLLAALGYGSWKNMAVEAYPDLSDVTAQVTTQVPGLAAEEVEQQITTPLERALANTPGLVTIRSSSTFALSLITLVFKDGSEDYFSRQRVLDRIGQVTLPQGVTPSLDPVSSPNGEIYRYTLESDVKNLMELSEIQRWTVIPALRQVTGVVDVNNFGGFTKEFRLELDPHQMDRFGVVLNDVTTAINANSANAGGGRIARGEQSYVVRGIGQVHSLDDLGNIVVKQVSGTPLLVSDLGKLSYGHQEREGILGKDNNPDTVEGIVLMLKYQNASQVLKGVHARVDQLNRSLAADNVRIVPYIDRDDLVQLTISKVGHTVLEGVVLVCIVLILFLGSPRSAIVAAVAIPMALISVFIFMNLTKMPANLFSLGAIDFGIIVDGAIVVMEALLRRREATPDVALTDEDVLETVSEVGRPIFFATLIIITAYFPLFAFQRAEAKLFSPMAFTVSYALFGALVCALLLIPGLAYAALKAPQKAFQNRPLMWLTVRYQRALSWLLARTWVAYVAGAFALLSVVLLGATAGREFLPNLDEGTLWLQVQMPTGLSLDKASEMAGELRRVLRSFPEVSFAITQLGRSDDGTDPWTPSHIEAPVGLKPYAQWPDHESKDAFIGRLNKRLEQLPGFSVGISQPIIDGVNDAVGGAHSPLVLRVYGPDLKEDRRIASEIVNSLSGERGTASISIFQEPPIPQLVIKVDRAAAARYGINAADIASLIQTAVGGAPVSQVYVEDRIYNVTAALPRADKSGPAAIGNLLLNSSSGARIPLSQLADIHLASGESTIAHEMNERELTIRVDNRDRDLASYLKEAEQRIAHDVHFDKHKVHLEWAGQFENQQRAQARLIFILSLVLLAMAALLFINFGKVRQVVLVIGVVPLATLGGLISLHLTGETLNVATAVGFIALFGVSVQNAIIMVANFRRILGTGVTLEQSVVMGAVERLRPVLMTATVASIGMLPAALATGVGTDVQRNLATVVVGGLVVSTLLTLLLVPAYYYSMERFFASKHWGRTLRRNR
jgi:cobalt-zinc-cadmium resistance protein CzcA